MAKKRVAQRPSVVYAAGTEKGERFRQLWVSGATYETIAEALSIAPATVSNIREALGLPTRRKAWTPEEDARFRVLWKEGLTVREIAAALGCTGPEAEGRRPKLDLPDRPRPSSDPRRWPDEHIAYLKRAYPNPARSVRDMSRHLGRSQASIHKKALALGLTRPFGGDRWGHLWAPILTKLEEGPAPRHALPLIGREKSSGMRRAKGAGLIECMVWHGAIMDRTWRATEKGLAWLAQYRAQQSKTNGASHAVSE